MKTSSTLTAALILATAALAAPAALADNSRESFQVRFAFNPNDPAAVIYSDLVHTASRACEAHGTRPLNMIRMEQSCTNQMVEDGVAKLGRADVAAVHNGYMATANAGTRG